MNGPEHYREAEQLLTRAADAQTPLAGYFLARAQVHSTLALAAAQIETATVEVSAMWSGAVRR